MQQQFVKHGLVKRCAAVLAVLAFVASATPAFAADPATPADPGNGITVSWLPTTDAAEIIPGKTTTSQFWVTNTTDKDVTVNVYPATAIPGNNGTLQVEQGADPRFPSIVLTPATFLAKAHQTVAVNATIDSPTGIPPGVYLLPAVVVPDNQAPATGGNTIQINKSIAALTTYQLAGKVDISMRGEFIDPHAPSGTLVRKYPGLPLIEVGNKTMATLRVTSYAAPGIYSYNEITGKHSAIGSLTFDDHTTGIPGDLRTDKALYFNGLYRDYPMTWADGHVALGLDHLAANIFYNPEPSSVASTTATLSLFVISPWWFAVLLVILLLAAWRLVRRTRHMGRNPGHRRGGGQAVVTDVKVPVASGVVVGLIGLALAFLSDFLVLGALGVLGIAAAVLTLVYAPSREIVVAAKRLTFFHFGAVLILVGSGAALAMTIWHQVTPGYAIAGLSIAAGWIVVGWVLNKWVASHSWTATQVIAPLAE